MGGNALNFVTRRVESNEEFQGIYSEIYDILRPLLGTRIELVPSYTSKPSFGDMDILVENNEGFRSNWTDFVTVAFKPKSTHKNGSVFSFDYKDFQIDLILAPTEEFWFSYYYYAYNDLGNFIGRTAHRVGFKHGHDGLWYNYRDEDDTSRLVKKILVTRNYHEALWFLGFPEKNFEFDTPEEIYEYAASSLYFDPRQFLLVNRSHAARTRDRKRKMYNGMLDWIRAHWPGLNGEDEPTPCDKQSHLERAFEAFPAFKREYDSAVLEHKTNKELKEKLNGVIVAACSDVVLEGKELGKVMCQLREEIEKYNLRQFVIDRTPEQCYHLFRDVLNSNLKGS